MQWLPQNMKTSDYEPYPDYKPYQILGMIITNVNILHISLITCSGERTFSFGEYQKPETISRVLDKVLSDERTTAYVTTIDDIRRYWLDCKDCDWYKSDETFLSEARLLL